MGPGVTSRARCAAQLLACVYGYSRDWVWFGCFAIEIGLVFADLAFPSGSGWFVFPFFLVYLEEFVRADSNIAISTELILTEKWFVRSGPSSELGQQQPQGALIPRERSSEDLRLNESRSGLDSVHFPSLLLCESTRSSLPPTRPAKTIFGHMCYFRIRPAAPAAQVRLPDMT